MGVRLADIPVDLDGYRAAMGYVEPTDRITFRELQERRDLIRKRMRERHAGRTRVRSAIGSRIRRQAGTGHDR